MRDYPYSVHTEHDERSICPHIRIYVRFIDGNGEFWHRDVKTRALRSGLVGHGYKDQEVSILLLFPSMSRYLKPFFPDRG